MPSFSNMLEKKCNFAVLKKQLGGVTEYHLPKQLNKKPLLI